MYYHLNQPLLHDYNLLPQSQTCKICQNFHHNNLPKHHWILHGGDDDDRDHGGYDYYFQADLVWPRFARQARQVKEPEKKQIEIKYVIDIGKMTDY